MPEFKLKPLQIKVLNFFGRHNFGQNFYWTGDTALAWCYFQHRLSVDLDFFSDDLFADEQYLEFINNFKKEVSAKKITLTLRHNRRLYLIETADENLKLELVFFPFPAQEKRVPAKDFLIKIDSLTDIMINKTLSAYQRREVKDIFDLYRYLNDKPKYNLKELSDMVEKKFGVAIEPFLLIAKINELADNLDLLKPLLLKPQKNLARKVKVFFQKEFNFLAKKKIA